MSIIVSVRLTQDERDKLDKMIGSNVTGSEGRAEFMRLLLHREWNRRNGLPKPVAKDYQSAFRVGRPILIKSSKAS